MNVRYIKGKARQGKVTSRCIGTCKKLQTLLLKVIIVSSSHESKNILVVPSISRERNRGFSYRFRSHPL
ncbi:hypothetical protein EYC80_004733 [Monilinia laxa]|uniref:Uncharacterized protein n=1 Tax=Monilinia laxa TaxID=61186 RepID=A0A5N6KHN4_MONLA|nr:hypothetical protein EYC80_004733 [Monilinia laxa]